jgi:hypothetical protein
MNKKQKAVSQQPITTQRCKGMDNKDKFKEIVRVLLYYKSHRDTTLGAARELGIERANICWYVSDLIKAGLLECIYRAPGRKTKFFAKYYTADERYWRKNRKQLNLFMEE